MISRFRPMSLKPASREQLALRRRVGGRLGTLSAMGQTIDPVLKVRDNVYIAPGEPDKTWVIISEMDKIDIHPATAHKDTFILQRRLALHGDPGTA